MRLATALAIAASFWGQPAPKACVTASYRSFSPGIMGMAELGGCHIWIDRRRWNQKVKCAAVVHEYGHILGHRHSTNPRSIMYPRLRRIPGKCRRGVLK